MLEHLLFDAGFAVGSSIADNLSTYALVKKHGIDAEACLESRQGMLSEGVGKHMVKNALTVSAALLGFSAALYGIDYLLGIRDNTANLHHSYLYIISGIKYLAAADNTFAVVGMNRAANAAHLPVKLFIKTIVPLFNRTVGKKSIRVGNYTISLGMGTYDQ